MADSIAFIEGRGYMNDVAVAWRALWAIPEPYPNVRDPV